MIVPISPAARPPRAPQAKAFDAQLAEQAELTREEEALQSLMMAQLKFEDSIMKKWIEMI